MRVGFQIECTKVGEGGWFDGFLIQVEGRGRWIVVSSACGVGSCVGHCQPPPGVSSCASIHETVRFGALVTSRFLWLKLAVRDRATHDALAPSWCSLRRRLLFFFVVDYLPYLFNPIV